MIVRFGDVEVDAKAREVRVKGEVQRLQPQAWSVLHYLLEHRDRVVAKNELLDCLWQGANVTEGSLQRAVSLARAALGPSGHEVLRTFPRQGYRFVVPTEAVTRAPVPEIPRPRYAENAGVHLAYYTLGDVRPDGVDIVYVSGWTVPSRTLLQHPKSRAQYECTAKVGRIVLFDKRGTGQSDRPKVLPDLRQRMEDLAVILDELGSERALLIGVSEGGPMSLLFAATYPERTVALALGGSFPRMSRAPGYPHGWSREQLEQLRGYIRRDWGKGGTFAAVFGQHELDASDRQWVADMEQHGASPGAALELLEMNLQADVRSILGEVRVPVHLVHSVDDPVMSVESSRYLANALPNADYEELPGSEHAFFFAGDDFWASRIERLLTRVG